MLEIKPQDKPINRSSGPSVINPYGSASRLYQMRQYDKYSFVILRVR